MSVEQTATGSPFDAIRRTRPDGSAYWSARELMPYLGYEKWERFAEAIERAAFAIINTGMDPNEQASRLREPSGATRQMREDFHLTRYGAYMVAMNSDPRKVEVAAAQSYFAVKTHEAEVAQATPAIAVPTTLVEALRLAADQAEAKEIAIREKEALEAQAAIDAPLVAQAATFRGADGLRTIPDLANDLKLHAASNYPDAKVLQQDVFDLAGRVGLIIRGDTVRHNQPTARAIESGWVRPKETVYEDSKGASHTKIGTRLTPRGYGRLWDAAVTNLTNHGTVLAPITKGIAA